MTPLIIISAYLALLLLLGLFSSRVFKCTAADYFLASRGIGSFLLLMSLFGTTMTAFALVGSTGKSFQSGIGVYGLMSFSVEQRVNELGIRRALGGNASDIMALVLRRGLTLAGGAAQRTL